jgi:UDP-N-acetylglucosamine--N-acetylmuramyl-(pentapeptide) pyrophosphoryl-undecaprenol N-acetylglucosamine transferase
MRVPRFIASCTPAAAAVAKKRLSSDVFSQGGAFMSPQYTCPPMRLIIAGGGTGGHLFPGVAIAEELKARDPSSEVLFVGTARGIEARVCPKLGLPLELIDASGLKTVGALGAVKGLFRVPRALWQSRRIIKRFRPDAVIGVGGYASGPVVLAAWLSRRPTAILEQNSIPGLANKILGKFVRRVFLAFDVTRRYFKPRRIEMTGNPIRAQLRERLTAATVATKDHFHIFCFGGSLGAKAVNALMVDSAAALHKAGKRFTLVHQTGKDDRDPIAARYAAAGVEADVRDFIDDMAAEYARADLIVSRSGATTVAELTAIGRPAILIPYPTAADDHQTVNARELAEAGAALVFPQKDLDAATLATRIQELMEHPDHLERMRSAMKSLGRPDAAGAIVAWLRRAGAKE